MIRLLRSVRQTIFSSLFTVGASALLTTCLSIGKGIARIERTNLLYCRLPFLHLHSCLLPLSFCRPNHSFRLYIPFLMTLPNRFQSNHFSSVPAKSRPYSGPGIRFLLQIQKQVRIGLFCCLLIGFCQKSRVVRVQLSSQSLYS